jgi:mRNA interferase MazF
VSKSKYVPRRGDVIKLNFDPQSGHEQAGRRPALVLSPTEYNRMVGLAMVCPITNEQKGYPWEVVIEPNDFVSGVVLADQVKNLDWRARRAEFICTPEDSLLEEVVEKAIALISPESEDEDDS